MQPQDYKEKEQMLIKGLSRFESLVISFSGGVDSSYLLFMACQILGSQNVIAVTADAPFFSRYETQYIEPIIKNLKVNHIYFDHQAMSCDIFIQNPPDRCYHCKKMIFKSIRQIAIKNNIKRIAQGSNLDDLKKYRPGLKAVKEFSIESPLVEARLSKHEIRLLAQKHELINWNQPEMACLVTRIPYKETISPKKLLMIDSAETFINQIGFPGSRVRFIDGTAKIEIIEDQLASFFQGQYEDKIIRQLKKIGFKSVIIDPNGYQSGFDDDLYMTNA